MEANSAFKILNWEEKPFSEIEVGGKLSRASVIKSYSGEIEGEGTLEYLMAYHPDGSAEFYGLERITCRLGNRSGSFVFQHSGSFDNGIMKQKSTVVSESGTGGLVGLTGHSEITAGHQQEYPFTLEYEFEQPAN